MECPYCATEIEIETFDVCNHGPVDGVEVFFSCATCEKSFAAHVKPAAFEELPEEEKPELTRNDAVGVTCLSLAGITVDEAIVATWTDEQWWQAVDWSTAVFVEANDHNDIEVPPMPEFLEQYQG